MLNKNKVQLAGVISGDIQTRPHNGSEIATFNITTTEKWKDRATGEPRQKTEWHRVLVFNYAQVEMLKNFCGKNTEIYVEGQLQNRNVEDKGIQYRVTEIVVKGASGEVQIINNYGKGAAEASQHLASSTGKDELAA